MTLDEWKAEEARRSLSATYGLAMIAALPEGADREALEDALSWLVAAFAMDQPDDLAIVDRVFEQARLHVRLRNKIKAKGWDMTP